MAPVNSGHSCGRSMVEREETHILCHGQAGLINVIKICQQGDERGSLAKGRNDCDLSLERAASNSHSSSLAECAEERYCLSVLSY